MAVRPDHLDALTHASAIADVLGDLATERDRAHHSHAAVGTDLGPSRLLHLTSLPARAPRYAELTRALPPAVAERLPGQLWSHQAQAIDLARAGRSVVVASGTASGKSLCYQAPMAEAAVAPVRPGTGLVLFPTLSHASEARVRHEFNDELACPPLAFKLG